MKLAQTKVNVFQYVRNEMILSEITEEIMRWSYLNCCLLQRTFFMGRCHLSSTFGIYLQYAILSWKEISASKPINITVLYSWINISILQRVFPTFSTCIIIWFWYHLNDASCRVHNIRDLMSHSTFFFLTGLVYKTLLLITCKKTNVL